MRNEAEIYFTYVDSFSFISMGIVFSFLVLSVFISLKSKSKSFIAYSTYLFFISLYLIGRNRFCVSFIGREFFEEYQQLVRVSQITAFISYVYFILYFLDIDINNKLFFRRIKKIVNWLFGISVILFFYSLIIGDAEFYSQYYFTYFTFSSLIIVVVVLGYGVAKVKSNLKYYFLIGTSIFYIAVLSANVLTSTQSDFFIAPILFFYWGLIIEVFVFSSGLSLKIDQEYKSKLKIERDLASIKNQQNINLESKIKEKEKELNLFHINAEKAKIKEVRLAYEAEINKLKVVALQNQMNPHFIFNSLNSIKLYIINSEKENAVYYLSKFSKLIRTILMSSNNTVTDLKEEIEFARLYIEIENIRYDDEIEIEIRVNPLIKMSQIKLPPLVLQPFLENALWHGFFSKKGNKRLIISVTNQDKQYVKVSIKDNGIGRKAALKIKESRTIQNESIGIELTQKRFEMFSKNIKNKASFEIVDLFDDNDNSIGTEIVMKLPV